VPLCSRKSYADATHQLEPANVGTITGRVTDAQGQSVAGAVVVLCEQKSGIPVQEQTCRPVTEAFVAAKGNPLKDIAHALTDSDVSFHLAHVLRVEYRLVAQSWKDADKFKGIFEVNGKQIQLHGVAEHVQVSPEIPPNIVIRPLGTGVLQIDEDMPNDATLLVISTKPTEADPILGFAGWGGAFMRNMIGGNRMPKGKTTVYGLPEGRIFIAMFAADNVPGWTEGQADIKPNTTTFMAYVPFVNSWSNSRHDPPEQLVPVFDEVKTLISQKGESLLNILKDSGIEIKPPQGPFGLQQQIAPHLRKEVELPSGRKTTFGDVMAAIQYVQLQRAVEQRKEQSRQRQDTAKIKDSISEPNTEGRYEEAFLVLYKELAERYPCFELKGIDWKAVGEELLPRAGQVKNNEEFGLLCMELVARLEDSHASVLDGSAKVPNVSFPQWDPGFACLEDDQKKPVVYYVDPGGLAEQAGVKVGMIVVSINGEKAEDVITKTMNRLTKYVGYSSERYLRYHAHQFFLRQKDKGAMIMLQLLDDQGKTHNFELPATYGVRYLPRLPVPNAGIQDAGSVSWKMLAGKIGYIYVRRIGQDLIPSLDKAVGELKTAPGLIIDVRGNSGGGFDAKRVPLNFALDRDSEEPQRPRYKGPMALLIDSRCISAGEGWASWFVANKRARLFGQATAGASSRKITYELKNGLYKVSFPVRAYTGYLDRPIERVGLVPDVQVCQSAQDLTEGRDTVLEAAKLYLHGQRRHSVDATGGFAGCTMEPAR